MYALMNYFKVNLLTTTKTNPVTHPKSSHKAWPSHSTSFLSLRTILI